MSCTTSACADSGSASSDSSASDDETGEMSSAEHSSSNSSGDDSDDDTSASDRCDDGSSTDSGDDSGDMGSGDGSSSDSIASGRDSCSKSPMQPNADVFWELCCDLKSGPANSCTNAGLRSKRFAISNGYDFMSSRIGRQVASKAAKCRPRHVWCSPPCTPWSCIPNFFIGSHANVHD